MIVAGGAINSPQLLQLSGIGPGEVLRDAGLAVRHEMPGVGRNLQDHLEVYVQIACRQPVSLFPATKLLGRLAVGLRWLATGGGVGASNLFEAGGFIRSRPGIEHPDLQYHFCRWRLTMTAQIHAKAMASKRMSVRCGRRQRAGWRSSTITRAGRRRFASTTWPPRATAKICAWVCA